MPQRKVLSGTLVILTLIAVISAALFTADYIQDNETVQAWIAQLGYAGVIMVAIIAGLNVVIPMPAASFVPIFTASGLTLPLIIVSLTAGTIIADFIGYRFGNWSGTFVRTKYPRLVSALEDIYLRRRTLIIPTMFLYVAFVPFPNEVMILPLAILGLRFRVMLLPLICGNLVNQTMYSVGIQNIFTWLF